MSIITLTTDFGLKDHFVGTLKGKIYSQNKDIKIIDISHEITPFNTIETAYIIGCAYKSFPLGTVHLIGVDSEISKENEQVGAFYDGHYFVCADNGILSILFLHQKIETIVHINQNKFAQASKNDLETLTSAACFLANGGLITDVGQSIPSLKTVVDFQQKISDDSKTITGRVVYIDHFGNAVTNISRAFFETHAKNRRFEIPMSAQLYEKKAVPITSIKKRYSEIADAGNFPVEKYAGSKLAVFNEDGFLEIAIFRSGPHVGSAKTLLGFNYRDIITINFLDNDR